MELAQAVREAREARGWTQAHLARKVGAKTRASVNKIEKGQTKSGPTVMKVLALLEIGLADIDMTKPPPSHEPQASNQPQLHPGLEALAADPETCERWAVKPEELDRLRQSTWPQPITDPQVALRLALAWR